MKDKRPICPVAELCGGCSYQGVSYEEQLKNKFGEVRGLLLQKQLPEDALLPIEPAPDIYAYRNKMEYTFGDMEKDGPMTLGMHRRKHFMSIVTVDECQLVHEDFNVILKATLAFARERGYSKYHKKRHDGLLRNLVLRRGVRTGEILVNIVTSSEGEKSAGSDPSSAEMPEAGDARAEKRFDEKAFVEMILGLKLENRVVGVIRTVNDRLADAVYCDELRVLYGRDYYEEEICGLRFKVGAFSFFQTNVEAVERLYEYAVSLLAQEETDEGGDAVRVRSSEPAAETVAHTGGSFRGRKAFDLYCGTGTISQVIARSASEVIGIELVEEAVEGARASAELNGLDNCRFYAGDVFEVMDSIPDRPDTIIVDPPRMGMRPDALDKIISYGVDQIVYVSCNPNTLVDNLYYLQYNGYEIKSIKPFDNFPWTRHTECVCHLAKMGGGREI